MLLSSEPTGCSVTQESEVLPTAWEDRTKQCSEKGCARRPLYRSPHFRAHVTCLTVHGLQAAPRAFCFVDTISVCLSLLTSELIRFFSGFENIPFGKVLCLSQEWRDGDFLPVGSLHARATWGKPRGLTPTGNTKGHCIKQEVGEPGFLHQS